MGWYCSYPSRDALIAELTAGWESEHTHTRIIAHTLCGDVLWSVAEITPKEGVTTIRAQRRILCDLIDCNYGTWGHKTLDEFMQPVYYSCPLAYLDSVPEVSRAWRERVRAWHAKHG